MPPKSPLGSRTLVPTATLAGIPSLCIEVCPTFYRAWTIPEMVMPVHDMSRSVTALIGALVDLPQQLVRILRGERQIRIRRARRPDACRSASAGAPRSSGGAAPARSSLIKFRESKDCGLTV